jgi:type II secretory pathway pseudopilin PulG
MRRLHSDESGFTITELLTAMVLGMIVLLAAAMLLDSSITRSNEVADRQDANQRGRLAMEIVSRDLRSQVCLKDQRPIVVGEDQQVSFYADLSETDAVDLRTFSYVPASNRLDETIVKGTGLFPDLVFTDVPKTKWILQAVRPIKNGANDIPIFRYYGYKIGGAPGELELLPTPLTLANRQRVVVIRVAFLALPTRTLATNTTGEDSTAFETDVYVRLADPTKPLDGPRCL